MKIFLFVIALFLISCGEIERKGSVTSDDTRYEVKYETNDSVSDIRKNKCIILSLYSDTGKFLSKLQTDVSMTSSNWGIGWLHKKDTLFLFSKEVGVRLYKIDSNRMLTGVKTTPELLKGVDSIINRKYAL
jgi:hypothetical protein